ncbi:hypothetical protein NQ318_001700 [Aromia moschata]|uniref:HTH CENPB-type domain-containing protein n=1 Tax=Aromia moschata TaxID=1265417 RepID=A0AAV8Y7B3_9CUCU|nr:hypothetical protein NQ318_001700 [Aromia moschata]
MGKICRGIRANWDSEMMSEALEMLRNGKSQRYVEKHCGIPRTTLRNHIKSGNEKRILGRKPLLSEEQERELESRIIKMSRVGLPLTPRTVRRSVFRFCQESNIPHRFNNEKALAGFTWYKSFLKKHPNITKRKPQMMNVARAQKLNPAIVQDHFSKLGTVLSDLKLKNSPQYIYNLDEKGCRLTLHHAHKVLAERVERRVHLLANEHAENVTVVACINASGQAVPPMIIFKGIRKKDTYSDNLPPGSIVEMSAKGNMTRELFIRWLQHFANFKPRLKIVQEAEKWDVSLYCLPSNTTHELQPLDKAVFRSFEHYWDTELLNYWETTNVPCRTLKKERFGVVFAKVWQQYGPTPGCSTWTDKKITPTEPKIKQQPIEPTNSDDEDNIPLINFEQKNEPNIFNKIRRPTPGCSTWTDKKTAPTEPKIKILSVITVKAKDIPYSGFQMADRLNNPQKRTPKKKTFTDILKTPEFDVSKRSKAPRKKALNYKAQLLKIDLFDKGLYVVNIVLRLPESTLITLPPWTCPLLILLYWVFVEKCRALRVRALVDDLQSVELLCQVSNAWFESYTPEVGIQCKACCTSPCRGLNPNYRDNPFLFFLFLLQQLFQSRGINLRKSKCARQSKRMRSDKLWSVPKILLPQAQTALISGGGKSFHPPIAV